MTFAPSEDSDQSGHPPSLISLRCPHEETLNPQLTTGRTVKTDQTGRMPRLQILRRAHRSVCWFCHEAALIYSAMRRATSVQLRLGEYDLYIGCGVSEAFCSVWFVDARPTGIEEVAGSILWSSNILSWRLVMRSFLQSFCPYRWFKEGGCQDEH